MNILQIKQIAIVDFLLAIGIRPAKETAVSAWYHAPYREDENPSFKVNKNRNIWYDFATAKSGDIIDLAVLVYRTPNIPQVLKMIERAAPAAPLKVRTFMPHPQPSATDAKQPQRPHSKTYGCKRWHPYLCSPTSPSAALTSTPQGKNARRCITPAGERATMPLRSPTGRAVMRYAILIIKGVLPRKACRSFHKDKQTPFACSKDSWIICPS